MWCLSCLGSYFIQGVFSLFQVLGQWGRSKSHAFDEQGLVEKRIGPALFFSLPDPARRPPNFLIVPTDQEFGTGWRFLSQRKT